MSALAPVVARTEAQVIRVSGADAVQYLEDVTSQAVEDLAVGESRGALVLDAAGEPLAVYDVVAFDDHVLLVAPDDATAKHALETMGSRTFLLEVTFEATDLAVVAFRDVAAPDHEATVASIVRPHGVDVVTADPDGLLAGVADVDTDFVSASRRLSDWDIVHGVPRWRHEIAPPHLPEEFGLLPTHVHLKKGCYPGQEAVARMWNLGRPRRRLATVRIDGDVEPGTEHGSGQDRVTLTGVAATDPPVGLAFVGRDSQVGDTHDVPGATIEVTGLVGDGLDVPGHNPRATRRRDTR